MFSVIRIPTKFSKSIRRLSDKEKLTLFSMLLDIWDWKKINPPDSLSWDMVTLIYWEWMNMESRNWTKPEFSLIEYTSEWPGTVCPSDPEHRVEYSIVEENRIDISSNEDTQAIIVPEKKEEYWNEEINLMQKFLRQAVWVSAFKDSKERWYVTHCYNLAKKIWKDEFQFRLKEILSDPFKAKNSNKLAYLYWELKSFIHSPVVESKKEWVFKHHVI